MTHTVIVDGNKQDLILPGDLKVGDFATIIEASIHTQYIGQVVVRSFDSLVSLTCPSSTWSNVNGLTMKVRKLSGVSITIEIGDEE